MSRLRVLVSNDDGIGAPGIVALVAALGSSDLCEVYVSAPTHERSASSHAITLGQHITAAPVTMQGSLRVWHCWEAVISHSKTQQEEDGCTPPITKLNSLQEQ